MKFGSKFGSRIDLAGALIFLGVLEWFMVVLAAETLFPGYSSRLNDLSDLASTVQPNLSPIQPSAMLFNSATLLIGLLTLISAILIYLSGQDRLFSALFGFSGLSAMAVGVFPGDSGSIHGLVALGWFVTGPLAAAFSSRMLTNRPLAIFSVIVGLFSLSVLCFALFAGPNSPFQLFGRGGEERMLAYPVVLWMMAFAGYLMGSSKINRG
jgi:hypothetical membrane protein